MPGLRGEPFIPDPPGPSDDRFSRSFKPWREWNVAVNFLTNLHCGFDESQVYCAPRDPPDVVYKECSFEVKEILDAGRKRHDEVKAALIASPGVESSKPQIAEYSPKDLPPEFVGQLVLSELKRIALKPNYKPSVCSSFDLLLYVNLLEHWFEEGPMPRPSLFSVFGWRSVSAVVASDTSLVLFADDCAPLLLRANAGRIRTRWESLD